MTPKRPARRSAPGGQFDVAKLNERFRDAHPPGTEDWLFVPTTGQRYIAGSTVPLVGQTWAEGPAGLVLPAAAVRTPQPIDFIHTYLTGEEIFGARIGFTTSVGAASTLDRDWALTQIAAVMGRLDAVDADWREVNRDLALRLFQEPHASAIAREVDAGRVVLAPQALLVMAKAAIVTARPGGEQNLARLVGALLGLQDDLAGNEDDIASGGGAPPRSLLREIVRSQGSLNRPEVAAMLARFQLRWRELPARLKSDAGHVDLEAAYARATGVPLQDFMVFGMAAWAAATQEPGVPREPGYFATLGWAHERLEAAIQLVSVGPSDLAAEIEGHEARLGIAWSFDPLRRYPILRLDDGRLLVLSPALLLERVFGWLPIFDVKKGLEDLGETRAAARADSFFRRVCELEALDSLASIAGGGPAGRLYTEEDLRAAFGRDAKTADAAIDYGDSWVVVEVSTRQLTRESIVGGSAEAINRDIELGVLEKARQLDATVNQLRSGESRLTAAAAVARRRFQPVLVVTEGFPLNPMTASAVGLRLAAEGLLQGADVGTLRILDQEELDQVDGAIERGGPSFSQLLSEWEQASLRNMSFTTWLVSERHIEARRSTRLDLPFERVWRPLLDAVETSEASSSGAKPGN